MKMKKYVFFLCLVVLALSMQSCISTKKLSYFQNIENTDLSSVHHFHDARIFVKDQVNIFIHATDPAAARPFNMGFNYGSSGNNANYSGRGYVVANDGTINFPVLGRIKVAGLTINECENLIAEKVKHYMAPDENPIVQVRHSNFHIVVLGEVGSPGIKVASDEKLSVVDVIAMAGDLTIYGKRDNVLLIRENEQGLKEWHRLNFLDADIMNSPYYYMQQNDIIYVEPTNARKATRAVSSTTSMWFSMAGVFTSLAAIVTSLVK